VEANYSHFTPHERIIRMLAATILSEAVGGYDIQYANCQHYSLFAATGVFHSPNATGMNSLVTTLMLNLLGGKNARSTGFDPAPHVSGMGSHGGLVKFGNTIAGGVVFPNKRSGSFAIKGRTGVRTFSGELPLGARVPTVTTHRSNLFKKS
jgi:hypothetical protein